VPIPQALTKFFETMQAPRLGEIKALDLLINFDGNLSVAMDYAHAHRIALEPADWDAALDYARRYGSEARSNG